MAGARKSNGGTVRRTKKSATTMAAALRGAGDEAESARDGGQLGSADPSISGEAAGASEWVDTMPPETAALIAAVNERLKGLAFHLSNPFDVKVSYLATMFTTAALARMLGKTPEEASKEFFDIMAAQDVSEIRLVPREEGLASPDADRAAVATDTTR